MVFEAKYQLFKIAMVMLILVGSSFSGNCQAERNPITLSCENNHQNLIGPEGARQLAKANRILRQNEECWSEFTLFASQQVSSAKQMLASLEVKKWWQELRSRDVLPAVQQRPTDAAEAGGISTTAIAVNLAANMTTIQWWQASNSAADCFDFGQRRMIQMTTRLEANWEASLIQLVESTSSNIIVPQVNGLIQAVAGGKGSSSLDVNSPAIESSGVALPVSSDSADEDSPVDPYWQYYSDCDFWGAQFDAAND